MDLDIKLTLHWQMEYLENMTDVKITCNKCCLSTSGTSHAIHSQNMQTVPPESNIHV